MLLNRIRYLIYAMATGPALAGCPLNAVTTPLIIAIITKSMTDMMLISSILIILGFYDLKFRILF